MYKPKDGILEKYADVLVNFALGKTSGIKNGDAVNVVINEYAKPLLFALQEKILVAGGHMILTYLPGEFSRRDFANHQFYELASNEQLSYFPKNYFEGLFKDVDHIMFVLAEKNKQALKGVASEKIMKRNKVMRQFHDKRIQLDTEGELSWTIAIYPTPNMAKKVGLEEKEYWEEVKKACYLDKKDPVGEWQKVYERIERFKENLNKLEIEKVHVKGEDADLEITIGKKRRWSSGSGHNIPSYEIFTCPDWRGTEGWIRFNQPLYRYGNKVSSIELEFENGQVKKAAADEGEKILKEMIATENADKVGEFSLTDSRHSRITKPLGETLFDENMGGEFGNTHIALGSGYKDCLTIDVEKVDDKKLEELGLNDSSVHTDIISTTDRVVTATLQDGSTKVIYKSGEFQV